ncbi:hypothetical protein ASG52_25675 [Methylobacterium sp. Leaf456]|uniref:hypothetical protein n=1 Tax=Methylobacterium sp. Leaf456 TaxID=1736382 RepID=UPI0006F266DA|nr:hypothetical protein [Methylobacterium sp. Leaf456]KQT51334.1 hypothetical protein ASG52_25675 [Methylobacterium sp. Leaf456]
MLRSLIGPTGQITRTPEADEERGLKWYFASNQLSLASGHGMNLRLAVLSALRNTRLRPHFITTGFRNDLTEWMEAHGVTVIPGRQPMAETIRAGEAAGRYHTRYLGHWLRCEVPMLEEEDRYVLYTDFDVVFLRDVPLPPQPPRYIACAPEFRPDGWHYFNSGAMVMNVANMRRSFPEFLRSAKHQIDSLDGRILNDQYAYNNFYVGRWKRLDLKYNWKPYWGDPSEARILHFHGPKIHNVRSIYAQKVPWEQPHWRTLGSLVASFTEGYRASFEAVLTATEGADLPERVWIREIAGKLATQTPPIPPEIVDLGFFNNDYGKLGFDAHWPLDERIHHAIRTWRRRLREVRAAR